MRPFKRKPMTGFFAVFFMLQLCDQVNLYGFSDYDSKRQNSKKTPYHYFDSVNGATEVHSFDLSIEVFKLMARVHNITIVE